MSKKQKQNEPLLNEMGRVLGDKYHIDVKNENFMNLYKRNLKFVINLCLSLSLSRFVLESIKILGNIYLKKRIGKKFVFETTSVKSTFGCCFAQNVNWI